MQVHMDEKQRGQALETSLLSLKKYSTLLDNFLWTFLIGKQINS